MIPETLAHYRILRLLGRGGMGEVYLAKDSRLDRTVALKVLAGPVAGDPDRRQRFDREAKAIAALNHPNIVTIHSVEEDQGVVFLTMELVEGTTLAELIAPGGMALGALLKLAIPLADAVGAAHQRGITHRDLKPANVMVTAEDRVKVLDFGLAKLQDEVAALEQTATREATGEGRIVGTVAYMAPEQAEGKKVDHRSDVFALGTVLFEMATGQRPFTGATSVSVLSAIIKDTPKSVTDLRGDLPRELAKIVRRCLQKNPDERYQTAKDLRNDLRNLQEELASGELASAASSSGAVASALSASRAKRRRALAIGSLAMALAMVAAGAVWWWVQRTALRGYGSDTRYRIGRMTRLTTEGHGHAHMAAISGDGRYVVHVKTVNGTPSLWVRQTATASDVQVVPPADVAYTGVTFSRDANHIYYVTKEGGGGEWGTLFKVPVLGGRPQRLIYDIDSGIGFAPDGSHFVFTRHVLATDHTKSHLMLSDIEGRAIRPLASFRDGRLFMTASWSPDGKRVLAAIIVEGHAELLVIDAHTGAEKGVAGSWAVITAAQWMPDGQSILLSGTEVIGQPLQIWQVFPESGQRTPVTNDLATYVGLSVSSDGTMVTVQSEMTSRVSLVTAGAPSDLTFGRTADGALGLAWLADGRVLFGSTRSGPAAIWAVNRDGSGVLPLAPGVENVSFVSSVVASHDGRYIFCARTEARASRIWRVDVVSGDAKPITSGPEDLDPIMSTDGQEIYFNAFANGIARTFRVPTNGGVPAAVGNGQPFLLSDILPDGRLLGRTPIEQDDGTTRSTFVLLSPDTGAVERIRGLPLAPHPFIPGMSLRVAGLPDGTGIAFVDTKDSVPNIWRTPINGGPAQRVTNFTSESIFDFAWSKDGKLAVTRGRVQDDLVLIARE